MNLIHDLRGIVTVLNTPFTETDSLDEPGLRRHVRYAVDAGVAGFLAPAMAGEVQKLSATERARLIEVIVDEVRGRVPVIGGASAGVRADSVEYARQLIDAGCDGVLAQISGDSDSDVERGVAALAELNPGFLILQDWDPAGPGLDVDLIARLAETYPVFQGVKIEVTPAGPKYSRVLDATAGRLHVSGGWGALQLIEAFDRGVHAFMPTAMHRAYVRIYRYHRHGLHDEAQTLFERILPVLAFTNQHLDVSIHFFKRLLHAQGVYATARVREPNEPFDGVQERIARELIRRVITIEEGVK